MRDGSSIKISPFAAMAVAVSLVIGTGIFGISGLALEQGGALGSLLGWLVATLAIAPLIYIFMALSRLFPNASGPAAYIRSSLGKHAEAALQVLYCGTAFFVAPATALILANYLQRLFGVAEISTSLLALMSILLVVGINLLGLGAASWFNIFSMLALTSAVLAIVGCNLALLKSGVVYSWQVLLGDSASLNLPESWGIATLVIYCFIGWESLSYALSNLRHPQKNIPKVYWGSFVFVVAIYAALAFTMLGAFKQGANVTGSAGLALLLQSLPFSPLIISALLVVFLSNTSAGVFTAAQHLADCGKSHLLPQALARLSPRLAPRLALLGLALIYGLVVLAFDHEWLSLSMLLKVISQNMIVIYFLMVLAFWKLTRGRQRWLGTGSAMAGCVILLSQTGGSILYSLALLALGALSYHLKSRQPHTLPTPVLGTAHNI